MKRGVSRRFASLIAAAVVVCGLADMARAQNTIDEKNFSTLRWRNIGPFRGGRVTAVSGVVDQPLTYYFGATGGGVWKTEDAGLSWFPVSDSSFTSGSIGSIAVADSDPNVIYAGTGEACVRSNFAEGDGVYKSVDAGKTWTNVGLRDTRQIGRVRVHPKNPDIVYVAALGNVFVPTKERGVFRSRDGGRTWENVLFVDDITGAADIAIDPSNPRVLYAGFWQVRRKPWGMYSGGLAGGVYKSTDGGDTWKELTNGLPSGERGRIGVTVSPANPSRVWAIVESQDGGMFRSDDAGVSWTRLNNEARIKDRPWYYSHIEADPLDENTVYVLALQIYKSIDGGRTYSVIPAPHVDHHGLWIDPKNPNRMINSNDGGANVTFNSGKSWSTQDNQPTAQFYHVITDSQFPYRVYGSQQDNSSVSIASRTTSQGIDRTDWHAVGGGEAGYIAPDPRDPNIVYAGSYYGLLTRYDHRTGQNQNVEVWPETPGGRPASDVKYRFQWTFPIVISPHDPATIYAAANVLFRSTDEGRSWQPISPDLTRRDPATLIASGGKLTGDNSSADFYATIFTVAESPRTRGLIWTGSDDGLVHVTLDSGKTWTNVTPPGSGEFTRIHMIEASPFDAGTAYVAASRYQMGDRKPYVYRTTDSGKTWTLLVNGLPEGAYVRAVREDPGRQGLLYAGTESGVFLSIDDGARWSRLQLNLPVVPITDLTVRGSDLVVATQGRAFWILDDITVLRQFAAQPSATGARLFKPRETYRLRAGRGRGEAMGENPASGVVVFYQGTPGQTVTLEFTDPAGRVITSTAGRRVAAGLNRFEWDMRYPDASAAPAGTVMFGGNTRGPLAMPGRYQIRLRAGSETQTQDFEILKDPRIATTAQDFQRQFDLLINLRDRLSAAHDAANQILDIREQIKSLQERASDTRDVVTSAGLLDERLATILEELVQMRIRFGNDVLTHPVKLNGKIAALASVVSSADTAPTAQSLEVFRMLSEQLDAQLQRFRQAVERDVPAFNETVRQRGIPSIAIRK